VIRPNDLLIIGTPNFQTLSRSVCLSNNTQASSQEWSRLQRILG